MLLPETEIFYSTAVENYDEAPHVRRDTVFDKDWVLTSLFLVRWHMGRASWEVSRCDVHRPSGTLFSSS